MSIERPNFSPESPEEKYKKLLLAGMETNKKYEKLSEVLSQEEDAVVAFESTSVEISNLSQQMENEMLERVNLLRQSGTTNIEDAFPRVKGNQERERVVRRLDELEKEIMQKYIKGMSDPNFEAFDTNINELKKMEDQARELMKKSEPQALNRQEEKQFAEVLKKLAEKNGYEIEGVGLGSWVTLRKGDLEFKMKHYAVPSVHGIGSYSRISKMSVIRKTENGENEWLMNYDRDWDVANQDPETQQEIDRVVAIFG